RTEQLEAPRERPRRRTSLALEMGAQLDAQHTPYRIRKARGRGLVRAHLRERVPLELAPLLRRHQHVETRVEGGGTTRRITAGELRVTVPVTEQHAVEAHAPLEHLGEERAVAVHLQAGPARERRHHRWRAGGERGAITGRVALAQAALARAVVALIPAGGGAAVAEEMLRRREYVGGVEEVRRADGALQSGDHGRRAHSHQ